MAERRMFTRLVVDSDEFLDLPAATQALYFHLGMEADDDGFVNRPKSVVRMVGASDTDLQLLIRGRFLLLFDGVVVLRHWRMANTLKNDRLKLPQFPDVAEKLYLDENGAYTLEIQPGEMSLLALRQEALRAHAERTKSKVTVFSPESNGSQTGTLTEENRREENQTEENVTEEKGTEENKTEKISSQAAAAAKGEKLEAYGGELGKGVVLLTEAQCQELLDKMGLEVFDYYLDKLSSYIVRNGAKVRNHYATMLRWWQEDSQSGKGGGSHGKRLVGC